MEKRELTDAEIADLVSVLPGTTANLYIKCEKRFGVEIDDAEFDRLLRAGMVRRPPRRSG